MTEVKYYPNGTQEWCQNGQLHRLDGPAVIWPGGEAWYQNGQMHRVDGPAEIRYGAYESWYLNGQYHREDGPAVTHSDGEKEWWINGQLHRIDGPAIEEVGDNPNEWWLFGEQVVKREVEGFRERIVQGLGQGNTINEVPYDVLKTMFETTR